MTAQDRIRAAQSLARAVAQAEAARAASVAPAGAGRALRALVAGSDNSAYEARLIARDGSIGGIKVS